MSPPPDANPGANPPPAGQPVMSLPADAMIVVPVRNTVLFPEIVFPITLGRPSTIAAAQQAVREQRQILIVLQREAEKDDPRPDDLYRIGTVANIVRYVTSPEGGHHLICQGVQRFRITDFVEGQPFLMARGLHLAEPGPDGVGGRGAFPGAAAAGERGPRTAAARAAGAAPDRRGHQFAGHAGRSRHHLSRRHAGREAGHPRDHRPGAATRQGLRAARPSPGSAAAVGRDRQQDQGLARHAPARDAAARADGLHPEGAGRRRLQQAGTGRSREGDRRSPDAARGRGGGAQGAAPPAAHARGGGRIQHDPHLSRHADRAAVGAARAQGHRHRRGAPRARRRSLRAGEDQEAHRRVPGGAQAGARGQGAHPVLRRAARRRQDLARPVDRRAPWAASSRASAWAACTTRPRSAATGAPISAPCRAASSRRSARPARATAS